MFSRLLCTLSLPPPPPLPSIPPPSWTKPKKVTHSKNSRETNKRYAIKWQTKQESRDEIEIMVVRQEKKTEVTEQKWKTPCGNKNKSENNDSGRKPKTRGTVKKKSRGNKRIRSCVLGKQVARGGIEKEVAFPTCLFLLFKAMDRRGKHFLCILFRWPVS